MFRIILVIVIFVVIIVFVLAKLSVLFFAGRSPHAFLPPIAEEYYVCQKCGSLHGGIYGKGPLLYLKAKNADTCWHKWRQISRAEFQEKAKAKFSKEWAKESNWYFKKP